MAQMEDIFADIGKKFFEHIQIEKNEGHLENISVMCNNKIGVYSISDNKYCIGISGNCINFNISTNDSKNMNFYSDKTPKLIPAKSGIIMDIKREFKVNEEFAQVELFKMFLNFLEEHYRNNIKNLYAGLIRFSKCHPMVHKRTVSKDGIKIQNINSDISTYLHLCTDKSIRFEILAYNDIKNTLEKVEYTAFTIHRFSISESQYSSLEELLNIVESCIKTVASSNNSIITSASSGMFLKDFLIHFIEWETL